MQIFHILLGYNMMITRYLGRTFIPYHSCSWYNGVLICMETDYILFDICWANIPVVYIQMIIPL